jgi:ATP-dependent DNA ligase
MRTRNGHPIEGVSHITKHLGKRQLDGELKDPKLHFQQSSGDTRSFRESPGVHFFVFDIPEEPMPLAERYQYLVEIANEEGWGTSSKPVHLLKHIPMQSLEHVSRNFNKALDNGFEGLVIKNHKALYTPKRGFDWMKLKNKRTTEGSVIGFKEGNESLEGTLGALIIRLYNHVEVDVGIGFSLALRGEIWRNREAWLGCTIEVEFHEFTPDGSLRHPRFKKRRIDK